MRDFIETKAGKHKALEVQYARGQMPQLVLTDVNEGEDEPVSIAGWKSDAIDEFLVERLLSPSG